MKGITIRIVKSKLSTDKDKKLTRKFCKFIESYKNASTKIYIYRYIRNFGISICKFKLYNLLR